MGARSLTTPVSLMLLIVIFVIVIFVIANYDAIVTSVSIIATRPSDGFVIVTHV